MQAKDQTKVVQKPLFFKTTHILSQLDSQPCGQLLKISKKIMIRSAETEGSALTTAADPLRIRALF